MAKGARTISAEDGGIDYRSADQGGGTEEKPVRLSIYCCSYAVK